MARPTDIGVMLRNNGVGAQKFICGSAVNVGTGPIVVGADTDVCSVITFQVDPNSTNDVFVGSTATQAIQLQTGQSITMSAYDLTFIEVKAVGSETDITVNYIGTVV